MNIKEYLEDKYGDYTNCYPFENNEKYVFMFVMDEIENDMAKQIISIKGVSKESHSKIFEKIMANENIEAFSYYADGDEHNIKALINNEEYLLALQLINDKQQIFKKLFS